MYAYCSVCHYDFRVAYDWIRDIAKYVKMSKVIPVL